MRRSELSRKTGETNITLSLNLDGTGISELATGVGFFDHMLTHLSRHVGSSRVDLQACKLEYSIVSPK